MSENKKQGYGDDRINAKPATPEIEIRNGLIIEPINDGKAPDDFSGRGPSIIVPNPNNPAFRTVAGEAFSTEQIANAVKASMMPASTTEDYMRTLIEPDSHIGGTVYREYSDDKSQFKDSPLDHYERSYENARREVEAKIRAELKENDGTSETLEELCTQITGKIKEFLDALIPQDSRHDSLKFVTIDMQKYYYAIETLEGLVKEVAPTQYSASKENIKTHFNELTQWCQAALGNLRDLSIYEYGLKSGLEPKTSKSTLVELLQQVKNRLKINEAID